MSLVRNFSYLFVSSRRITKYGFLSRLITCISMMIASIMLFVLRLHLQTLCILTVFVLAIEFLILWIGGGLKRVLSGFALVMLFAVFGFLITITSMFTGFTPPSVEYTVSSMLRMVALVLSFATMLQFLTTEEIRWILIKVGLKDISTILGLTFSQLPLTLMHFSEALTTIKLKFGGNKIYKVVKPLVVYSIINSLNIAEALYIHGIYPPRTPKMLCGLKDLLLISISVTTLAIILLQYYLI